MADFPNQDLASIPNCDLGTFASAPALWQSEQNGDCEMIGKLFGAWLGDKIAGKNEGAKGAILGYGAAAVAKRSVPTLAALALGGWAWKKWRDHKRSEDAETRSS